MVSQGPTRRLTKGELGVGHIHILTNKNQLSRAMQLFDVAVITTGIAAHPLRMGCWNLVYKIMNRFS